MKLQYISFILSFFILTIYANDSFAQGKGNISGKIVDSKSGEELIGAVVSIKGTSQGVQTDLDGKYFISLAPGTYDLQVVYLAYKTQDLKAVEVKSGQTTFLNISLDEDVNELQEVVVQSDAGVRKESEAVLLIQQKNAVSMSSGISAELIRKTPDRTTADIIKRISGASVQDGKFAVIRGLADRYNYAMINDAPLPSSESDRKAFNLEMVPSQIVDNVTISKTATPDMPGDFAGGLIQINTRGIPDENTRFVNIGLGGQSLTTFQKYNFSPDASSTDWLGFDNGKRQLSNNVSSTEDSKSLFNNLNQNSSQITSQSQSFHNNFQPNTKTVGPNYQFQFGASQRLKLFGNDFGVIGAATYNNVFQYIPTQVVSNAVLSKDASSFTGNQQIGRFYNVNTYKNNVNIGGILNFAYKIGSKNKFSFKNLFTQNSEDQTFNRTGLNNVKGSSSDTLNYQDYGYYYSSNTMISSQLAGEHVFAANNTRLKYTFGYNNLYKEIPNYKRLYYQNDGTKAGQADTSNHLLAQVVPDPAGFLPLNSGIFYSKMNEHSFSANYEVAVPFYLFGKHEFKAGGMEQFRFREFTARNFLYGYSQNFFNGYNLLLQGPSSIFANQNIKAPDSLYIKETTQGSDHYTASSTLHAGFAMLNLKFFSKLNIVGGLRIEAFTQRLASANPSGPVNVDVTWVDPLPSVNIIYSLNDAMNLRFAYAKTVSRPEFREFAPLSFYEFNLNAVVSGNPDLNRTVIQNFDFKYEWYPSAGIFFAVNPFIKSFKNPIMMVTEGGNTTNYLFDYQNASGAMNYGVEFEARVRPSLINKSLEKSWVDNFTVFGNLALIKSVLDLSGIDRFNGSNLGSLPLPGQSPYVLNAGIQYSDTKNGWDFTLTGNQVGRYIAFVGVYQNQTIWVNPRFVVDASITKTLGKLQIRGIFGDLLAQSLVYYQDLNNNGVYDPSTDLTNFKYKNGQKFTLQFLYNF